MPVQPPDHLPLEAVEEALRRLDAEWAGRFHQSAVTGPAAQAIRSRSASSGDGHRGEDAVDDVVGGDAVGERLVGEHEPVAQHVVGDLAQVLRERVLAAADECQRPPGEDQVDRRARAGAVGDEAREVAEPDRGDVARRVRELDRVLDQRRVDEDAVGRPLQRDELVGVHRLPGAVRAPPSCRSTMTNSSVGVG